MNKTTIDWPGLTHTLNPVIGCERNCSYCYGKRMNDRFKWIKDWTVPGYYPKRLNALNRNKKPCTVFVGSMSDICFWPDYLVDNTIEMCCKASWHTYMFLSKSMIVYNNWNFPENCWLGLTVEKPRNSMLTDELALLENKTFLSIEPICGMGCEIPETINLVIVGAMTGPNAIKPEKEWIESIKHPNIHYKKNIQRYL